MLLAFSPLQAKRTAGASPFATCANWSASWAGAWSAGWRQQVTAQRNPGAPRLVGWAKRSRRPRCPAHAIVSPEEAAGGAK